MTTSNINMEWEPEVELRKIERDDDGKWKFNFQLRTSQRERLTVTVKHPRLEDVADAYDRVAEVLVEIANVAQDEADKIREQSENRSPI